MPTMHPPRSARRRLLPAAATAVAVALSLGGLMAPAASAAPASDPAAAAAPASAAPATSAAPAPAAPAAPPAPAAPAAPAAPTAPTPAPAPAPAPAPTPTPTNPTTTAPDHLAVDLSKSTGAFRGGASGTLYGLGDDGVPSQSVIDGAHLTNTSQKPPDGAQHPNGDALDVEKSFFAGGGKDLYIYVQDEYPDWPYNQGKRPGDANGDGVWDYLPILRQAVEKVATQSADPSKYVIIPFNEPDGGNWYPDWATQRTQFLADWSAAYETIQSVWHEHGLGHARVGGPGDSSWHLDRSTDFLTYAKAHHQLPDVFIWHELGTNNLATFRSNFTQYRALEKEVGIKAIPVNITEFGMLRDMGVPGQLIQWFSMFEGEKVDAQTAYWNYAGNLSDNSSGNNGANGGWWLFKWYGDLAGSQTVALTPPALNAVDSLQGMAAVDKAKRTATVLFGGGSKNVSVDVAGIDAKTFGTTVDVQVRADRLNGAEGASLQPPVIVSTRATVKNGKVSVAVPNDDRYSAYQVRITPRSGQLQPVDTTHVSSVEAEDTTLTDAVAYPQDPTREWSFMASGSKDVGSFNKPTSSATWSVTVPHDGDYRLTVLGATNSEPGKQALFVDGKLGPILSYSADLSWTYRGTTDVTIPLTKGTHQLSVRASADGTTLLPGSDITLDRFDLTDVTKGENATYPAQEARLTKGATLDYDASGAGRAAQGQARLTKQGTATIFAATAETGYYDVTTHWSSDRTSALSLKVGGRQVATFEGRGTGDWTSTARVWLPQGISELTLGSSTGARLTSVTTTRGDAQKAADRNAADVLRTQAESLVLSGTAAAATLPASAGSNGSADASGAVGYLGFLGNGAANTASLTRPEGFGAGAYTLVVGASNAEKSSAINYNPQVVSRFLDVTEKGGKTVRAGVRYDYSWNNFWNRSIPLDLTTPGGPITLGNATAFAPNLDTVTLARFVAGQPTTVRGR